MGKLYEKCPTCGGSGTRPGALLYPRPACPSCLGEKYIETGLTTGQVERLVMEERRRKGDPAAVESDGR
jgi:DnaJ-class molecular chaperone